MKSEDQIDSIGLPIDDEANELPIISEEHSLDERAMLDNAIEKQRHLYKPGFISDAFDSVSTYIVYYPLDKTFGYSSMYRMPYEQVSFKLEAGTSFEASLYDSMVDSFVNPMEINHDTLQMMYGEYIEKSTGDYYVTATDEDTTYILQIGSEEEGYTEDIVRQMGATLRTEEDGAYDPFYQQFDLNLDKVKFPEVNEQRAVIHDASVSVVGLDGESEINITYMFSEQDTIVYHIQNTEFSFDDSYEKVSTFTLSDGTEVNEYVIDSNDKQHFFHWMDREYDYTITASLENTDIIDTEDMQQMIESAINDERVFENKTLLQPINKLPERTKAENNLIELLEDMNK